MEDKELKQIGCTTLEIQKGENSYRFSMPMGASLAEACDAAFTFFKAVDNAYRTTVDKEKERVEAEKKKEECNDSQENCENEKTE